MELALDFDLAGYIDHALLDPSATPKRVEQCCIEAERYNFPAVCVYPSAVRQAADFLYGKRIAVCTVIGFPSGATTPATKLFEAQEAAENGATELDVVINVGLLKAGMSDEVYREIAEICEETGLLVKAILEMGLLDDEQIRLAAEVCLDAGAAFLKTHTGWFGGATIADVRILRAIAGGQVGIKASGGIRTYEQASALVRAGASRLGTSRGPFLLRQRDTLEEADLLTGLDRDPRDVGI
ncbi:deoxyribose-phosphate aldolase [Rubidibacter lacunae KORDI 51-2]|uniref:Deoxyribose-phosphate aldolase n=1 Tax=Rubidibacter lacunae KORDI 51-2 TaxID=582515 RepID=U5DMF5_9CHRO|nr:deoxyribose-phosphate aldolase [Rubidibacter lacunae]ERN41779.1 deoxyribose-phosphate aldolase [Rubidibacter lacunae KORDI 51-2]